MNSFSLSVLGLRSKHMVSSNPCPTVSTSWQLYPHYRPQMPPFLSVSPGPPLAHNTLLSPEAVQTFPAGLPASAMDPVGAFPTQRPCHLLHVPRGSLVCVMFTSPPVTWRRRQTASRGPGAGPFQCPAPVCPVPILVLASCPDHTPCLEITSVSPRRGLHLWPPLHSVSTWFASSFSFHTMNDSHHQAVSASMF